MLVFSFNTLFGVACSLGFNMEYYKYHHKKEAESIPALYHHGHYKESKAQHPSNSSNSNNDECCGHGVISFNLPDKTIPDQVSMVHPVFATAFIALYFQPDLLQPHYLFCNIRAFTQSYHPPIPDIRIALQSFLI